MVEAIEATGDAHVWLAALATLRRAGVFGDDELHYLAERMSEGLLTRASGEDPMLVEIHEQTEAIERRHGLRRGETWTIHEGPPDWQELNRRWEERADALVVEAFRAAGLSSAADLLARSPLDFEGSSIAGRKVFEAHWKQSTDPLSHFLDD